MTNGKQGTLIKRIDIRKEQPGARFEVTLNAFTNPSILEIVNTHPLHIELKLIFTRVGGNSLEEVIFTVYPHVIEPPCSLPFSIFGKKEPGPVVMVSKISRL